MSGQQGADGLWDGLAASLLHPTQLHIVEAMRWIDRPLSPSQLVRVFCEEETLSTVAYHVRRLAGLGALRITRQRKVRGTFEKSYRLAAMPKNHESRK